VRSGSRQYQSSRQHRNSRQNIHPQAQQPYRQNPQNMQIHPQYHVQSNSRSNRYPTPVMYQENNYNQFPNRTPILNSNTHQHNFQQPIQKNQPQLRQPSQQTNQFVDAHGRSNANNGVQQGTHFSETSSLHSDYEAEVSSVVSGTSSTHYQRNNQRSNVNSSLQLSAVKVQTLSNTNSMQNHRNVFDSVEVSSVVSNSSSKASSRGGGSATSLNVPASVYSRVSQQNQYVKHKQHAEAPGHPYGNRQPQQRQIHHQQPQYQMPHPNVSTAPVFPHDQQHIGMKMNSSNRIYQHQFNNQNKLPHGLTVHELKEMTRARLAAEAAVENPNQHSSSNQRQRATSDSARRFYSQNTQVQQQNSRNQSDKRHKNKSSLQSAVSRQGQQQMEPPQSWQRMMTPQEQLLTKAPQHHQQHRRKVQPLNQQHQQFNPNYIANIKDHHFISSEGQHQLSQGNRLERSRPHLDSVDSASVTSFNSTIASEYLGSETASTSFLGPSLKHSSEDDMLFVRSWSFPSVNNVNNTIGESGTFPSTYFDGNVVGSRRRLGSSPPGFHLEVAHEDRPFTDSKEFILPRAVGPDKSAGARTFDDLSQRSVDSSLSQSGKLHGLVPKYHNEEHSIGFSQISSPSEIKSKESSNTNDELGSEAINRRGIPSNGELPNWVAESVLGTPLLHNQGKTLGLAKSSVQKVDNVNVKGIDGVFRAQNNPIGFTNENSLTSVPSNGYLYSDVSLLGRSDGGSGSWGGSASVMDGSNIADFLNQDFSKLLSLNTRHEESDVNNDPSVNDPFMSSSLKSRIDPEVVGSPCSVDRVASSSLNSDIVKLIDHKPDLKSSALNSSDVASGCSSATVPSLSSKSQRKKKREKSRKKKEADTTSTD